MTTYINPPQSVETKGRRLSIGDFDVMTRALKPDEVLVGLYDRLIFKLAPVLTDRKDWEEFERQYSCGQLISRDYFALPKSEAQP